MAITQSITTRMPNANPATAMPRPVILVSFPICLMATAPKIIARIAQGLMNNPIIPKTSEACAKPLLRIVPIVGG